MKLPVELIVLSMILAGCSPTPPPVSETQRPKVKVIALKKEVVSREIESFGSISFLKKADLSSQVEGTVDVVSATEGMTVHQGQGLLRLKNPQLEMRKSQAEAALSTAKSAVSLAAAQLWEGQLQVQARMISLEKTQIEIDQKKREWEESQRTFKNKQQLFDAGGATLETINGLKLNLASQESSYQALLKDWETRQIGLRDQDLVSFGMAVPTDRVERLKALTRLNTLTLQAQLESAQTRQDAAATDVASAQSLLDELNVKASMDGIVGAKYVEVGEHLQPGTKLVTLIDTQTVYAVFPLQEDDAVSVQEGMVTVVEMDAFPGKSFTGRVEVVSPLIDSQSGSVSIKARLENPGARFKPGMFARVRVKLADPKSTLLLPQSAIAQKKGTRAHVFTVVNGRVFGKDVDLGKDFGGRYVIAGSLHADELIIDAPSPLLKEGEEVDVR